MNIEQELENLNELYKNKQYELTLERCQELLLIEKHPKLFFVIGYIKDEMQDYECAIESYTQAIELDSTNAEFYYCRGIAKHNLSDYEEAIEDFNKIIELNLMNTEAFLLCSKCKCEIKQYADALKDINIALKWNPNNEKLLEFRKIINDAKGDKNES